LGNHVFDQDRIMPMRKEIQRDINKIFVNSAIVCHDPTQTADLGFGHLPGVD
jgi:hypothetical protein